MEMIRSLLNQTNAPPTVVTNTPIMETILRRWGLWERSRSKKQWAVRTSPGQLREQQRRESHPKLTSDAVNLRWWSPQEWERQADTHGDLAKAEMPRPAVFGSARLYICSKIVIYSAHCACACTDVMPISNLEPNQTRYEVKNPFPGPLTLARDVRVA